MPALRTDLRVFVETIIETEAAKDQLEVGLGCTILYVRKANGDISAYQISVNTNLVGGSVGTSFTFPDYSINRLPTEAEINQIVQDYAMDLLDAIKVRRAELRAAQ